MRFLVIRKMDSNLTARWKEEFAKHGHEALVFPSLRSLMDQMRKYADDSTLWAVDLENIEQEYDVFVEALKNGIVKKLMVITGVQVGEVNEKWVIQLSPSISKTVRALVNASDQCLEPMKGSNIYDFISVLLKLCRAYSRELLREKQELSMLAEALPTILYKGGKDWTAQFFGPRIEEISGYSAEDFESGRVVWKDLILPEDYRRAKQAIVDALHSNFTYEREYRIRTASGEIKWIKDVGRIILDEVTKDLMFYGVALDITSEKILRDQIDKARKEWESTFNSVDNLILVLDRDFVVTRVNKAFKDRVNLSERDIIGKKCWEIGCKKREYSDTCPCKQRISNGVIVKEEMYSDRLKGYFLRSFTPIMDNEGKFSGAVFVYTDVTQLKEIENELTLINKELNTVIDTVEAIVVAVNENGVIYRWNRAAENIFGIAPDKAVGSHLDAVDVLKSNRVILSETFKTIQDGVRRNLKDVKVTLSGKREIFLDIIIQPFDKAQNDKYHVLVIAFDITEKKYMEMKSLHAQKLQSMGILAAGIAHEINTPAQCLATNLPFALEGTRRFISIIEMYEQLERNISDYLPKDKELMSMVSEIDEYKNQANLNFLASEVVSALTESIECVEHITKIVNSVQSFSHVRSSELKKLVNINKSLKDIVTMTRGLWKRFANVELQLDDSLPPVKCNPSEMRQVLLNIFMNAVDAIKEKKEIDSNFNGVICITTRKKNHWCEIIISDNGIGIPDEIKDKVFEPFFTTKDPGIGTGQGLAIAQSVIVRKHNGQIFFESDVNNQTVFVIRLPLNISETGHGDSYIH